MHSGFELLQTSWTTKNMNYGLSMKYSPQVHGLSPWIPPFEAVLGGAGKFIKV